MGKKGVRFNSNGKGLKLSGKIPAVKTYAGRDRYSDAVIVELGSGSNSAFQKYFGFWKKAFGSKDKWKKRK